MAKHKYIKTPEDLYELFDKYKNSLETLEMEVPHVKLGTTIIRTKEPMTMQGFKCFGHENGLTVQHYIDNPENAYSKYREIVTRIKDEIFKNNFSRASVGIYKEALIAKQLGLSEKIESKNETQHTGTIKIEVIKSDVPISNSESDIKLD